MKKLLPEKPEAALPAGKSPDEVPSEPVRSAPARVNGTLIYLHRLHFPSESGQTIQVLRDYHALADLGYTVHLFYRTRSPLTSDEVTSTLDQYCLGPAPSFFIHAVVDNLLGSRFALKRRVRALIASAAPSESVVLVVRTPDHAREALWLRACAARRVKIVMELHETALPHLVYGESGRSWRSWWSKQWEREVMTRVDGIVCTVSSQVAVLDRIFPRHAPVVVLPNGVSLRQYDSAAATRNGGRSDVFRLRYAGQLTSWKNPMVMVDALRYLPSHVVLDIAGGKASVEDKTRAAIVQHARRAGVSDRVTYVGYLPLERVPEFLIGADAVLLPLGNDIRSRYFTCPMKLFEYAASLTPMVVTRQPTTLSLIQDGVHALMVEPNSPEGIAQAVERLLKEPSLGRELAINARQWVERYSYPQRAACYHTFLTTVVARA